METLAPASDARPAEWIGAHLRGLVESVESIVPAGFPSYLRLFHPAYRGDGNAGCQPVRWADVAEANRREAHAGMQFDLITNSGDLYEIKAQPGIFDAAPTVGSLPQDLAEALVPVLAHHTSTPERCWFAVWDGWGDLRNDIRVAPKFCLPIRSYYLLGGSIAAATVSVNEHIDQSASLWWPDDHAWCVATEIDFNTTYLGCHQECSDEILRLPGVEAYITDPAARGYDAW